MKKALLILGLTALFLNIISGLILSVYEPFNMWLNSAIIALNALLIWLVGKIQLKGGFTYSLPFLFLFIAVVQMILGFLLPCHLQDNGYFVVIIILFAVEGAFLILSKVVSK